MFFLLLLFRDLSSPEALCVFAIGVIFTVGIAQVRSLLDRQLKGLFDHWQVCFPVRVTMEDAEECGYILGCRMAGLP